MRKFVICTAIFLLGIGFPVSMAQDADAIPAWSGTGEQAQRGEALYQRRCASCHGRNLVARDPEAPTLAAPAFAFGWYGKTIAEQFERIRTTMPLGKGGTLSDQDYIDVVAYILNFNGYASGTEELKPDPAALDKIVIGPQ